MNQPNQVILYLAVSNARWRIRDGTVPDQAVAIAAQYFGADVEQLARLVNLAVRECEKSRYQRMLETNQRPRGHDGQ